MVPSVQVFSCIPTTHQVPGTLWKLQRVKSIVQPCHFNSGSNGLNWGECFLCSVLKSVEFFVIFHLPKKSWHLAGVVSPYKTNSSRSVLQAPLPELSESTYPEVGAKTKGVSGSTAYVPYQNVFWILDANSEKVPEFLQCGRHYDSSLGQHNTCDNTYCLNLRLTENKMCINSN